MRTGWSVVVFAIGAFTALGLAWASPTAALLSLGVGALMALLLASDTAEEPNEADAGKKRTQE